MLTTEELRLRDLQRQRLFVAISGAIALALLIIFGARPMSGSIKAWQARRHAARVPGLLANANWTEARGEALAAYQLRPNEPATLRAAAQYLSRTHQQEALEYWEQLAKRETLTRDDLRDEASIALLSGEVDLAATTVKSLLARKDCGPTDWLLAAQVEFRQGNRVKGESYLLLILQTEPATTTEQLQAATALLALSGGNQPADSQAHVTALERLETLSAGQDAAGLDALVILAQRALTDEKSGAASAKAQDWKAKDEALAEALENHPLAKAPQKLFALNLRMQLDPSQHDALIARAIDDWKNADNDSLNALATWLNSKGEYRRELEAIPLEKSVRTHDLFLARMDALGALGRWGDIKQLLESERFPLDPVMERMYLARCSAQLGQKTAADNNWQRALEAADGDKQKLMALADYAEKNGALAVAGTAYNSLVAQSPRLRAAQQGRLRIAQDERDTKKMHAVLANMLKVWPNDLAMQNDEAYTRLLLLSSDPIANNAELAGIERLARALVQREPASLPHRTLLALTLLKEQRPVAAIDVYQDVNITTAALTPSALAVHAAILSANGRRDEARSEVQQISLAKLLPEEQAGTADLR